MLSKILMGVVLLWVMYLILAYDNENVAATVVNLGWIAVFSLWAIMAQAAEHRAARRDEHAQLLQALDWEPPKEEVEPQPRPWSPNMPPVND